MSKASPQRAAQKAPHKASAKRASQPASHGETKGVPGAFGALPRKPMVRAERVSLIQVSRTERVGRVALNLLLDNADVITEGQRTPLRRPPKAAHRRHLSGSSPSVSAGDIRNEVASESLFASVMFTLDLAAHPNVLTVPGEPGDLTLLANHTAQLLQGDPTLPLTLDARIRRAIQQLVEKNFTIRTTEVRIRTKGPQILIDVDVEAHLFGVRPDVGTV